LRGLGPSNDLVQELTQDWHLAGEVGVDTGQESMCEIEVWLEEKHCHGLET